MHKLTTDHPAFSRTERFIQAQVSACRPSAEKLAAQIVLSRDALVTPENFLHKVAEQIDHLENRMEKRLRRYYGLTGKYVGH